MCHVLGTPKILLSRQVANNTNHFKASQNFKINLQEIKLETCSFPFTKTVKIYSNFNKEMEKFCNIWKSKSSGLFMKASLLQA